MKKTTAISLSLIPMLVAACTSKTSIPQRINLDGFKYISRKRLMYDPFPRVQFEDRLDLVAVEIDETWGVDVEPVIGIVPDVGDVTDQLFDSSGYNGVVQSPAGTHKHAQEVVRGIKQFMEEYATELKRIVVFPKGQKSL